MLLIPRAAPVSVSAHGLDALRLIGRLAMIAPGAGRATHPGVRMNRFTHAALAVVLSVFGVAAASGPAEAGCYDVFGCSDRAFFRVADLRGGPNCEFLWTMRNEIYFTRGYCFKTPRALTAFGNDNCRFQEIGAVPLNRFERANVAAIAQVERERSCPR